MASSPNKKWTVLDLFSGAGGMSCGFARNDNFEVIGGVDAQLGKPSSPKGSLQCNTTYQTNIGAPTIEADLSSVLPSEIRDRIESALDGRELTVLISCAPCTGFSRAQSKNHMVDDPRNSLVARSALFVEEFRPEIFLMENARELLRGNFTHHFDSLRSQLRDLGYEVHADIHRLDRFGLPQVRERALVVATRSDIELRTLDAIWEGYSVTNEATYVRRAIEHLPPLGAGETHSSDPMHACPSFGSPATLRRLQLMPHDGGSWADLVNHPEAEDVLTPAMKRSAAKGRFGSHPDVYGRMWWDRPSITIKRECAHVGNGRYSHPEQDRLCSVREMAILQGFPIDYDFSGSTLSNMYRHIGDAVPPLISFQLARVCEWILTGEKPALESLVMPKTHLKPDDIIEHVDPQLRLGFRSVDRRDSPISVDETARHQQA